MNATSLYVTTSRLVFQSDYTSTDQNWMDLYRLVPYLRQSLSCTVCGNLLIEPHTPLDGHCQHHVCKMCIRGKKNLKPACNWCKDYDKYEENMTLRILLQCYKSLCEHIINTPIYNMICKQTKATGILNNGINVPSVSLVEFIEEGAKFQDVFKSNSGLTKSAYSILPCVFNPCPPPPKNNVNNIINSSSTTLSSAQQQQQPQQQQQYQCQQQKQVPTTVTNNSNVILSSSSELQQHQQQHQQQKQQQQKSTTQQISHLPPIKTVSNGSAMYSVLYTGIGNKITIKRKTNGDDDFNNRKFQQQQQPIVRSSSKPVSKRRGCRCGNATPTPGKLTCCGQRCPCYVDQKSCIDCKCRGCRNPHRPDGGKIRPHIPELACYEIQMADDNTTTNLTSALNSANSNNSNSSGNRITSATNCVEIPLVEDFGTHHHVSRLTPTKPFITNINTSSSSSSSFDGSNYHQMRQQQQPLSFENVTRESLLISSPEGNFQVVNVFTPSSQNQSTISNHHSIGGHPHHHHHNSQQQIQCHATTLRNNSNHHQIPEISTTLPQIILQKQEPVSLSPLLSSSSSSTQRSTTITTISPGRSSAQLTTNTITLSPIIVSNSNPFPTQIFSEEEIITTQCSPSPTQPPPLIEITSSEHSSSI